MLNKIPFTMFGNDDEIYFNNARMMQLEKAMGKSVIALIRDPLSMSFVTVGLQIGLAHAYRPNQIIEHINKLFDEGDTTLSDLGTVLGRAIMATGIFGADIRDEAIKNVSGTEEKTPSIASKNG